MSLRIMYMIKMKLQAHEKYSVSLILNPISFFTFGSYLRSLFYMMK